jgi:hypothetical protein
MANHHKSQQPSHPAFSHFHLVDPLPASDVLDSADALRALLLDAAQRGAGQFELLRIVKGWRMRRRRARPSTVYGLLNDAEWPSPTFAEDSDSFLVRRVMEEHERAMRQEFDGLPEFVQGSFAFENRDPATYYAEIRAEFYQAGYSDPCDTVFSQIRPATLLGKRVIGGLHQVFIDRLSGLEALLNSWSPGLAPRVAAQLQGIGGFVPRNIQTGKKKAVLSNHAFGMAIDIDPVTNPQFRNAKVIAILRQITGFDFGQELQGRERDVPEMDRAIRIYSLVGEASDRLRTWLLRYLPVYEAEVAARICETPEGQTIADLVKAGVNLNVLKKWSREGIETIPMALAAAMATLGFRWGASYRESKDIMHFELLAEKELPPDRDAGPLEETGLLDSNDFALRLWLDNRPATKRARSAARTATAGGDTK